MSNDGPISVRVYGTIKDIKSFIKEYEEDNIGIMAEENVPGKLDCELHAVEGMGDMYYIDFYGEIKWGDSHLHGEDGDLTVVSKKYNLIIEWYASECSSCWSSYRSIVNGEEIVSNDYYEDEATVEWPEDFEEVIQNAIKAGVNLNMEEIAEVRADNYKMFDDGFGELYLTLGERPENWDFHTIEEIKNGIEPKTTNTIWRD